MNLANKLTTFRVILVPIFLLCISWEKIPYGTVIAMGIFIIAAITDQLDGYVARSRNQITDFGKFMDPLADKLLVTTALVVLIKYGLVPAWAVAIIIAREFAVSGLRSLAASQGNVIAASWWGKIKTVIQIIFIIIALIQLMIIKEPTLFSSIANNANVMNVINVIKDVVMYLTVIATVLSGVDYFYKNRTCIDPTK